MCASPSEEQPKTSALALEILPQKNQHAYSVMLLQNITNPVQATLDNWEETLFIVT